MKRDYIVSFIQGPEVPDALVGEVSKGEIARLGRSREYIYSNSSSGFFVYIEAENEVSAVCKALDLWQAYSQEASYALVRLANEKDKEENSKFDYAVSWSQPDRYSKLRFEVTKITDLGQVDEITEVSVEDGKLMVRAKDEDDAIAKAKEEIKAAYEEKVRCAQGIIDACQ